MIATGSSVEIDERYAQALLTGPGFELLVTNAAVDASLTMQENISHQGSGKAYKRKGGAGYHIVSKPGDYPAKDTGDLIRSFDVRSGQGKSDNFADIVITSPYALDLELGTSKMSSRPFILRSISETIENHFHKLVNDFVKYVEGNPGALATMLSVYRRSKSFKPL